MKVTINEKPTQENAEYPCLKAIEGTRTVVLFTAKCKGTVIAEDKTNYGLGYHSHGWAEQVFTPFNGSITLEND